MAIDKDELQKHLEDYERVTGTKTDRFICPITLRACDESELIKGHILNDAFIDAAQNKVIQYGPVDYFYGSAVEPELIRFLNLNLKTKVDLLRERTHLTLRCEDGSEVKAFFASEKQQRKQQRKQKDRYPIIDLGLDGESVGLFHALTKHGDPRLAGEFKIAHTEQFLPLKWVAAMLKAGHLTLFSMLGYNVIDDAFGETLRYSLARFYDSGGTKEALEQHFSFFRGSLQMLFKGGPGNYTHEQYELDTLHDHVVLFHATPSDTVFAASCLFKINGLTTAVTLPQSMRSTDVGTCCEWYQRLMNDQSIEHKIHRSRYIGTAWEFETTPAQFRFLQQPPQSTGT